LMLRAITVRLVAGCGFLAISAYAFSRGDGFWNLVYGVLGAIVGVGSLAIAAVLMVARMRGINGED